MSSATQVVAKMKCNSTETSKHQYGQSMKVRLGAVYGTEGENKDFSAATPSGECWMQIDVGRPAAEFFEPGADYYVMFTKAPCRRDSNQEPESWQVAHGR